MGISEKDYQELWNSTLQIIKDSNTYDDAIFNTYIKPTRLFRINDDVALISVPNKISSSIFSGSLEHLAFCLRPDSRWRLYAAGHPEQRCGKDGSAAGDAAAHGYAF